MLPRRDASSILICRVFRSMIEEMSCVALLPNLRKCPKTRKLECHAYPKLMLSMAESLSPRYIID